ncbi:MAG: 2-amino-4-hydroxy-6-hydroxymethyldihydropteridine diphosphokinase [Syntrophobacterales bacterium]|nr:2-amino-4-hydroxy-6-hydroxymethyldihydropteridine diphosphokinase [Syntrophobacterales bacterium]
MEEVILGLGSNMGDGVANCEEAVRLLSERCVVTITALSSWYATEPQGYRDQNWFINGALCGKTSLSPEGLLFEVKKIESYMGREETFRWGPRIIDIDILFYGHNGETCVWGEDLQIPHKMLHRRRFVLIPLVEIAPSLVHPVYRQNVKTLLRGLPRDGQIVKRVKKQ